LLFIEPDRGGQCGLDDDGYLEAAPEFVAEVASSSVSYDLHDKFDLYRDAEVREYLVWRVNDAAIDWFVLADGEFVPLTADEQGTLCSRVFPGLWLDAPAMLRRDRKAVIARLEQGLATTEHADFVKRIAKQYQ
jgi:Uma2 family endonuclease